MPRTYHPKSPGGTTPDHGSPLPRFEIEECWHWYDADGNGNVSTFRLEPDAPEEATTFWTVYLRGADGLVDALRDYDELAEAREFVATLKSASRNLTWVCDARNDMEDYE